MFWEDDDQVRPGGKREPFAPVPNQIIVFGTSWCGMTQVVRRYLERAGLPYKYLDIEEDPDAL